MPRPLTDCTFVLTARSPFVRGGLLAAVEEAGGTVLTQATDPAELVDLVLEHRPQVVVLALEPDDDGVALVTDVRAAAPATEVVALLDAGDAELLELVAAGAHGLLPADMDPARLPFAIAGVLAGEVAFPRRLARRLAEDVERRRLRRRSRAEVDAVGGAPLTEREHEVLEGLAGGRTTAAVGAALGISEATVRRHAANARAKLGAQDREDALRVLRGDQRPPASRSR